MRKGQKAMDKKQGHDLKSGSWHILAMQMFKVLMVKTSS